MLKKTSFYSHGIDYLRVNFDEYIPFFEKYFGLLDYDNSNFMIDSFMDVPLTIQKVSLSVGPSVMLYTDLLGYSVPIMAYSMFRSINTGGKKSKIDFYGSFFRLVEMGEIPATFLEDRFRFFPVASDPLEISRVDYRIDFFNDKKIINSRRDILDDANVEQTHEQIWKTADYTNWAIGCKRSKRVYIRYYDKLADSRSKNKFLLYGDYFDYNSVERLELEFGNKFCKGYTFSTFNSLLNKITFIMGIYQGKVNKIYEKEVRYDITKFGLHEYNKIPYIKNFLKKGKYLHDCGLDPFKILSDYLDTNDIKSVLQISQGS